MNKIVCIIMLLKLLIAKAFKGQGIGGIKLEKGGILESEERKHGLYHHAEQ